MNSSLLLFSATCFSLLCACTRNRDSQTSIVPAPSFVYDFKYQNSIVGYPTLFSSNDTSNHVEDWNFGDGARVTLAGSTRLKPVTHTYTRTGTFTVSVTINDKQVQHNISIGLNTEFYITGTPAAGSALHFGTLYTPPAGKLYRWDFGDGTSSTDSAPNHVFTGPGTHTVSLQLDTNSPYSRTVRIVNDPLYTHTIAGTRTWSGGLSNLTGNPPLTTWPSATSLTATYVDPLKILLRTTLPLCFNPDSSTAGVLVYTSNYNYYYNYAHYDPYYQICKLKYYIASDSISYHEHGWQDGHYNYQEIFGYDLDIHTD